ncbi:exonuclease GOR [Caerostris extrusa]|uniref:Exonuclease GOR n=1 Tax=Caerostris extrusa TaxID=172846 RepID=A0AAV4T671_CAEEX|nr:exonuclease GOR [Caerostris extrusa]
MKDLIQKYLNCIPLNSEELYVRFWRHTMSYTKMKQKRLSLPDPKSPGRVLLVNTNVFSSKSMRLDSQMCRCGKIFSMLEDDWYVDDHGCNYHLGKQSFAGPNYGLYNCCKTVSPGCAFSKHHVSFHRPYEDVRFVHTVYKKSSAKKASNIFSIDCEMAFTTKGMEGGQGQPGRHQRRSRVRHIRPTEKYNLGLQHCI